jgi:hypothetical protein
MKVQACASAWAHADQRNAVVWGQPDQNIASIRLVQDLGGFGFEIDRGRPQPRGERRTSVSADPPLEAGLQLAGQALVVFQARTFHRLAPNSRLV